MIVHNWSNLRMLSVRMTFRSVHQLVGTMVLLIGFSYSSVVAADPATSAFDHPTSSFWSFQAPKRPAIPTVRAKSWPSSPIDSFVLAKLEPKGIHPARAAETMDIHIVAAPSPKGLSSRT